LRATFKSPVQIAEEPTGRPSGVCPQPRKTPRAPAAFLGMTNPLPACMNCHGTKGDGNGPAGMGLVPPPRNFTCGELMKDIPDGQLFWIIKNGSPGTGMMPFSGLSDEEVWQLIHYLRSLAK